MWWQASHPLGTAVSLKRNWPEKIMRKKTSTESSSAIDYYKRTVPRIHQIFIDLKSQCNIATVT
jgi:hypothetical protein